MIIQWLLNRSIIWGSIVDNVPEKDERLKEKAVERRSSKKGSTLKGRERTLNREAHRRLK